ncbi:MAG: hypothetical protein C5B54_04180 [Acidobacteria bacterium]|nr:MAG: hypothetical protein C5B54_04180 [Acidobacteriota bacterium]
MTKLLDTNRVPTRLAEHFKFLWEQSPPDALEWASINDPHGRSKLVDGQPMFAFSDGSSLVISPHHGRCTILEPSSFPTTREELLVCREKGRAKNSARSKRGWATRKQAVSKIGGAQ